MKELFEEKDFTDAGGYHKRADFIRDMVNERIKKLVKERDDAREMVRVMRLNAKAVLALWTEGEE
jgi:hypothetical protein